MQRGDAPSLMFGCHACGEARAIRLIQPLVGLHGAVSAPDPGANPKMRRAAVR
eukprot:CAMPEP_0206177654 /NCGR_PEP_ID=MMETSP1474-20131121/61878_1 /ASSEMBLY_ACC=CAM_ASM_001110 /TAXON_ID=97495 /ORGANISM="Imantonia sp., Strain RCC918" /LENGTH=52 /DNA_ID=CAMNT_0053589591 /DNA_START=254 /DNA_END=409 /DNA_ORIENTATION=-